MIGIIGILLSAWGLFISGCGMLAIAGVGIINMSGAMVPRSTGAQIPIPVTAIKVAILLGLAVFLLVASVGLLQRHRSGAKQMVHWARPRIAAAIVITALHLATTNYFNLGGRSGASGGMLTGAVAIGAVVGFSVSIAFPIFLLIWFRRDNIQREVEQWR